MPRSRPGGFLCSGASRRACPLLCCALGLPRKRRARDGIFRLPLHRLHPGATALRRAFLARCRTRFSPLCIPRGLPAGLRACRLRIGRAQRNPGPPRLAQPDCNCLLRRARTVLALAHVIDLRAQTRPRLWKATFPLSGRVLQHPKSLSLAWSHPPFHSRMPGTGQRFLKGRILIALAAVVRHLTAYGTFGPTSGQKRERSRRANPVLHHPRPDRCGDPRLYSLSPTS